MTTFADREPHVYDELPLYFKTRRAAQESADWHNASEDWGYSETIVVRPAPDDITVRDIVWDEPY